MYSFGNKRIAIDFGIILTANRSRHLLPQRECELGLAHIELQPQPGHGFWQVYAFHMVHSEATCPEILAAILHSTLGRFSVSSHIGARKLLFFDLEPLRDL